MGKKARQLKISTIVFVLLIAPITLNAGYNPLGQRQNHAAIWTAFATQKDCEQTLTNSDERMSLIEATEDLLQQLVGDNIPNQRAADFTGYKRLEIWTDPERIHMWARNSLAVQIYNIHNAYADGKWTSYSFGRAIRGHEAIKAFQEKYMANYEFVDAKLQDVQTELAQKDRMQSLRAVKIQAVAGISALGAAIAGAAVGLGPTGVAIMGAIGAAPFSVKPSTRLAAFINGDHRFRVEIGPFLRGGASYVPERIQALSEDDFAESKSGFYIEGNVSILAPALHALRKESADALEQLRRSCVVHSVSKKCQEYTAFLESYHLNELDFASGISRALEERAEANSKYNVLGGRLAAAFFHDSKTQEPILITWLQFKIVPPDEGKREPSPQTKSVQVYNPAEVIVKN